MTTQELVKKASMKQKLYPFSAKKHAHDIELIANIQFGGESEVDIDRTALNELRLALVDSRTGHNSPAWLTGKQIQLAKECIMLADEYRANYRR